MQSHDHPWLPFRWVKGRSVLDKAGDNCRSEDRPTLSAVRAGLAASLQGASQTFLPVSDSIAEEVSCRRLVRADRPRRGDEEVLL